MPAQFWESCLTSPDYTADGSPLANSVTLTDVTPTPNLIIPANFAYPGMILTVTGTGRYSTTATPTILLGAYWGGVAGTALATTGALTTASGVTNIAWRFTVEIMFRTIGSSGTVMTTGFAAGLTSATGSIHLVPASAPVIATIDTTSAKALTIGAQWGTSSASNTLTCHTFRIEALN